MYIKLLGSIAVACSLAFSQGVLADDWGCKEGLKSMVMSLKMDESTKTKVMAILDNLRSTKKATASQMESLDKQIHDQVRSDKMDQTAVNDLVDQKAKLIGDMMKAKISAKNQIFMLLNPEQKAELSANMQKLEEKISNKFKSCHEQE